MRLLKSFRFNVSQNLPLLVSLGFAVILRFYNFSNRISMGQDSARDAFVSLEGARMIQFPLSGPFTSVAPVTTGPWYWMQLILARILLPTNYAPWLLLGIYSVLMVLVMYAIGVVLGGKRLGLILALVTTFARHPIQVATDLNNPSVIGFYIGVVLFLFVLLVKREPSRRMGWLVGLVYGMALNTHLQAAGIVSLLFTLPVLGRRYLGVFWRALAGMALTFVPLLLFEFTNHWYNSRHFLQYLLVDRYKVWTPMRWLTYVVDYWPRYIASVFGGEKILGTIVMLGIGFVFSALWLRRKLPRSFALLLINFLIQVVIVRYHRGERYFGYLQFFHPFLILFTGYVFAVLGALRRGNILGSALLALFLVAITRSSLPLMRSTPFTQEVHQLTERVYGAFGPGPFRLFRCRGADKWDIQGLVLRLRMDERYGAGGKTLIYRWGCSFPDVRWDGTPIYDTARGDLENPERIFPKLDNLYDVSEASEAAMAALGWEEVSPTSMYQSAARWWMDEQP